MTEKQEKILKAALELFADRGFASTSTSKVAQKAGVSEGLIFKHFTNKDGLLNAILQQGHEKIEGLFKELNSLDDPKDVIKRVIEIPFTISDEEMPFWRLLYSLKWQADVYDGTMSNPIKSVLIPAFGKLEYKNPEAEAQLIMVLIDGLAVEILLRKSGNAQSIKSSILSKYNF
ncbi:MAG: TetR/AcrR family transcriptional regulator [Cyclobacteriaceae bacterium]